MPSNGATTNVVRRDLDLHFQGHEFSNLNISKTVRASEKCSSTIFIDVDISHPFVNVVLHDLDLHFQDQPFSCYALAIKYAQAADVPDRFASTVTARAVELLLLNF